MKKPTKSLVLVATVLGFGTLALSAQSCAATSHLSAAAGHSAAASAEVGKAGLASGAATVKVAFGVAAVPVYVSGAALATAGSVVSAVGDASAAAGATAKEGADEIWDFATGDPAKRPVLNRERGVPPVPNANAARLADLPPSAVLQARR